MAESELIQQVRMIDPARNVDRIADVLIVEGKIQAIADTLPEIPNGASVIPGKDAILGPGLVDLYSYSGEPGHEVRETLSQLIDQAVEGGFTRLNILPQTQPPLDTPGALQQFRHRLPQSSPVQVNCWGGITQNLAGLKLTELAELYHQGIAGFSDGCPLTDWVLIQRLLEYAQPLGCPIALWPCMPDITGDGVIREGIQAVQFGLPPTPIASETSAIAAILEIVSAFKTPVHFMRLSTARGVELIQSAKQAGLPISASTVWMHLLCHSDDLRSYDPMLRFDPPLGNETDQLALIQGLEHGVIDAIAIDHRVYTYEEKTVPFAKAPPGCPGLKIAFPILWQKFVETGKWTALQLWQWLSLNPTQCLQQAAPSLEIGEPAEMFLFQPQGSNLSRKDVPQWWNQPLHGRIQKIWSTSL